MRVAELRAPRLRTKGSSLSFFAWGVTLNAAAQQACALAGSLPAALDKSYADVLYIDQLLALSSLLTLLCEEYRLPLTARSMERATTARGTCTSGNHQTPPAATSRPQRPQTDSLSQPSRSR